MAVPTLCGILHRMNKSPITIIDDGNLRGIVAPASVISKEMLEDFIDDIEYADPKTVARVERSFNGARLTDGRALRKEADRNNSWIPFEKVEQRAKKAL